VPACPRCQRANPEDAAFCSGCGAPLERLCPACQRANAADAAFCNGCGGRLEEAAPDAVSPSRVERAPRDYTPKHLADKILQSKSALEGERKQVTVLFADVKGSMELAEQMDPEVWHQILDRFFSILTEGVHRFEGTVNQYLGDGIMALFGAPIAHEDHAQRACYAALHLRDELRSLADALRVERGIEFPVRIGLNSGEVVVGKIGDDLRMDYTAQGQVVGIAARLQELAAPGLVYLTQPTADLVRESFELRDLGESGMKGVSAAVRIHELAACVPGRGRFDLSRSRQLSQFVGREQELTQLQEALERALDGHGQMVAFVGEADETGAECQRARIHEERADLAQSAPAMSETPQLPRESPSGA
jgi:class 3 adenylate cyclase